MNEKRNSETFQNHDSNNAVMHAIYIYIIKLFDMYT